MLPAKIITVLGWAATALGVSYIAPGAVWYDTNGVRIDAHGGMVFERSGTFYWVGYAAENQTPMMYSSTDLMNWSNLGAVSAVTQLWRPKYAKPNGSFWIYGQYNRTAMSLRSASLTSGYKEVEAVNLPPNNYTYSDTGMFFDPDANTYYLLTSADHNVIQINQIDADGSVGSRICALAQGAYEAPGIVKVDGYYYLIASSKTGYRANPNKVFYASALAGPWAGGTDIAPEAENTYGSQNSFEFTLKGSKTTTYIYMGDAWDSTGSAASTYMWLPMSVDTSSHNVTLDYYSMWTIDVSTGVVSGAATKKRYEAEHATTFGKAEVRRCDNCPSKRAVHDIGPGSEVLFSGIVGTGEMEHVTFHYTHISGSGVGEAHIFVNDDSTPILLSDLNSRAGRHSSVPVPLKLMAGETNTIRFGVTGSSGESRQKKESD
ncbi:Arabinanase/levansucrase/invertase [Thozetella sp. PMI_491]|nr:Arabinanase/levansucrase/invertase [Thozetella sp. PMI_491]